MVNLETGKTINRIPVGNVPIGVSVSGDGNIILVSNKLSYNVTVIDSVSKEPVANIPVGAYPIGIAMSHDGKRAYGCNYNEKSLSIIDMGAFKERERIITNYTPTSIAIYTLP